MADIIFRVVDLPPSVKATVSTSPDGCFNVYINAKLNKVRQQKAADHEMRHIYGDHLFRDSDASQDEQEAELNPASIQSQSSPPDFAQLRAKTGYTAYQVSRFVGISTGRYVRIEQGLATPLPDELLQLTSFFKRKGLYI